MFLNYQLFVSHGITLAFQSSKTSLLKAYPCPSIKKASLAPSFVVGFEESQSIPVIDLFALYGITWHHISLSNIIVKAILFTDYDDIENMEFGILVDDYLGTANIEKEKIQSFGHGSEDGRSGIAMVDGNRVCVLDIDNLFSKEQLTELCTYLLAINWLN